MRIVILLHEHETSMKKSTFTISHLQREWERMGHATRLCYGIDQRVEADLIINHVDLTITPAEYVDFLASYPLSINARMTDISKTTVSTNLLDPTASYDGPVVIKTNANSGGRKDFHLRSLSTVRSWRLRRLTHRIHDTLARYAPGRAVYVTGNDYRILASKREVPGSVWKNPQLVVEKLLTERTRDDYYVLRAWTCLGRESLHVKTLSASPIVKGTCIVERTVLPDDAPSELKALRRTLGVDYGRFDYAMIDGRPVVYDVNRTPTTSKAAYKCYRRKLRELATGILDYPIGQNDQRP